MQNILSWNRISGQMQGKLFTSVEQILHSSNIWVQFAVYCWNFLIILALLQLLINDRDFQIVK